MQTFTKHRKIKKYTVHKINDTYVQLLCSYSNKTSESSKIKRLQKPEYITTSIAHHT